ncbi:MAG: AI-2E family transporter [Gammaproteobacteria bacterium]|nr:AI-2E family transporter [Gammaproteobacteria bacterium]
MNRKLIFWTCLIVLVVLFFYSVRNILLPFVVGILFAYLLDPIADKCQSWGLSRGTATSLIVVLFYSVVALLTTLAAPVLFEQLYGFFKQVPTYISRLNLEVLPYVKHKMGQIDPAIAESLSKEAGVFLNKLGAGVGAALEKVLQSGLWLLNLVSLVLITPVVTFYLLRDWDTFVKKAQHLLPREHAPVIKKQLREIDLTIAAFIRGQLNVCLLLGLFYGTALALLGLNFGFIIGLLTGLVSFIPYVGMLLGAGTGLLVAFFQYGSDLYHLGLVAGVFALGQVLEGNFITPKLVGDKIRLHPVWLIFGMLAGASLLGLVGVLVAVPLTAVIGVLVRFAIEKYVGSEYYSKEHDAKGPPPG